MGAGIAEVFARNGFDVVGVELNDEALERGREHLEHSTGRAVKRGKITEAEQAELLGRITLHHRRMKDLADADFVVEAVVESLEVKKAIFRELDEHRRARTRSSPPTPPRCRSPRSPPPTPPRPGRRRALLQPGAGAEPRRDRSAPSSPSPTCSPTSQALVEPARQEPGRLRRQGRLHRQHAAVRLPQPRGLDVRGPLRHPRGHRRGDALRLRLPDGPARAARPDRPRHGVRDPRHDVQAGPRPPARAGADPQADGHRRPARPQDRPRLLHLRGARQPDRRRRRPAPRRADDEPQLRHDIEPVGVVGTGTMATRHRRGLRQGRVRRRCTSAASDDKVDGRARDHRALARQGRSSAASSRSRPRPRCSAG